MPRDVVQLPADGTGKRLDAYSYLSTVTGGPLVYSQTTVPVSSDGAPVFPSSSVGLGDGYATPAVSAVAVLPVGFNGTAWDRLRTGAVLGSLLADVADRSARLLGHVSVDNFPSTTDVADRAGRALGAVSISGTPTVTVGNPFGGDVTDRSARLLGHVTVDNASLAADVSDRSARLLGHVSLDGTADVADRSGRLLGHVTVDNFPSSQSVAVSNFPATQPVSIAATVTTSITGTPTVTVGNEFAGDVTDRAARLLGHVTVDNASLTADVADRSARLLGHVSVDNFPATQPVSSASTLATDVQDRTARLLGHVTVDNASLTADVSDRSARLLGQAGMLVYDGSNWQVQGGVVGDTGQNAGLTAGSRKEVPFSTTIAQSVAVTDCSAYRHVSVVVSSQGTGSTVAFQGSNDNANWFAVVLKANNTTTGNAFANFTNLTSLIWSGPVPFRYFRLNVLGISAGTTAGTVEFFSLPMVDGSLVGVGGVNPATVTPGDGVAAGAATYVWGQQAVFNGATWERMRSATGATGTAAVAPQAATAGGATPFRLLSAASTNLTTLKASAGMVYNITAYNAAASLRYLKLYNKASNPAPATDTPIATYPLAASGGQLQIAFPVGLAFATGIAFSITTNLADTDTVAIAANDVILNVDYK